MAHLSNSCLQIYAKTVIYEYYLNIEAYSGNTKLSDFIRETFFSLDGVCSFFCKYPVLLRRLSVKLQNMLQYYQNMFSVLDAEHEAMLNYGLVCEDVITDVSCSEGDTHEKGASVTILTYNKQEVVYKPRDLRITQKYTEFIHTINDNFDLYKLPTVKTIWGEGYVIEERIAYKPCEDEAAIRRFYERIGYHLAVLYLFNGNDIHYENILACGEYPYMIDLETLFSHAGEQFKQTGSAHERAVRWLQQSVRGTHLLPSFIRDQKGNEKTDISGLGGQHAKLPTQRLALTDWGTDHVRFIMQDVYLQDTHNIPTLNRQRVDYKHYQAEIINGFEKFMRIAYENKELFIAAAERFSGIKTRQVLRATTDYAYMLQFASHPNYTQSMVHFERFLDSVWNLPYADSQVNCCEEAELLVDDIPVFYCDADGVELVSGSEVRVQNFYQIDGVSAMKRRIEALDCAEIKQQTMHILCAFEQADVVRGEAFGKLVDMNCFRHSGATSEAAAPHSEILRVLNAEAICGDSLNDATWCALNAAGEVTFLSVDLEGGSAGILAYLLELSQELDAQVLIDKTVNGLLSQKTPGRFHTAVSGVHGWASVLLPLCRYLEQTYNEEALSVKTNLMAWCETKLAEGIEPEALKELPAAIIAFVSAYEATLDYKYLQLADTCVALLMQAGSYCIRALFAPWQVQQTCYALELYDKNVQKSAIKDFVTSLVRDMAVVSDDPVSALYCMKYQLLRRLDCNYSGDLAFENVFSLVDGIEPKDVRMVLAALDLLILAKRCGIAADDWQIHKIEQTINELFASCAYSAKQYNATVLGFGLNSLLCGIGLRWEYAYNCNESVYYRLI